MQAHNIPEGMIWKRIRLAFLSPKILKAIVDGKTNWDLTIKMLTQRELPLDWSKQEALFLGWIPCYEQLISLLFFEACFIETPINIGFSFVFYRFKTSKKKNSLLNSLLIPKNREKPTLGKSPAEV